MLLHSWTLPTGDVYEVYKNGSILTSWIQRQHETTICCQGTNSMRTIRQYFNDVELCQTETMNGKHGYHDYWIAYKKHRQHSHNRIAQTTSNIKKTRK